MPGYTTDITEKRRRKKAMTPHGLKTSRWNCTEHKRDKGRNGKHKEYLGTLRKKKNGEEV